MKYLFAILQIVMFLSVFRHSSFAEVGRVDNGSDIANFRDVHKNLDFEQSELLESLPDGAAEYMRDIDTTKLTFGGVMSEVWGMLLHEAMKPLKMFLSLTGVVVLCAIAETIRDSGGKGNGTSARAFEMAGVLAGAGIMSTGIAEIVVRTGSTLTAAGAFMLTFIPVLAGIMAVMGQLVSANLFNVSVLAASQVFSQFMATALMPLSVSMLGVSIAGAVSPDLKTEKLANTVKTVVVWVLGFSATLFTGLLTVQSLVSGSTDSVAMKAVKFTVSGGVPFIGGAVGDALGVVNGSVAVLKSTTGAFGIVALVAVCLPTLLSVIGFRISLSLAASVAELFGVGRLGSLLKSGECVMSIILAMLVCFMLIMLVSIALMIRIGSGV